MRRTKNLLVMLVELASLTGCNNQPYTNGNVDFINEKSAVILTMGDADEDFSVLNNYGQFTNDTTIDEMNEMVGDSTYICFAIDCSKYEDIVTVDLLTNINSFFFSPNYAYLMLYEAKDYYFLEDSPFDYSEYHNLDGDGSLLKIIYNEGQDNSHASYTLDVTSDDGAGSFFDNVSYAFYRGIYENEEML